MEREDDVWEEMQKEDEGKCQIHTVIACPSSLSEVISRNSQLCNNERSECLLVMMGWVVYAQGKAVCDQGCQMLFSPSTAYLPFSCQ